MSYQQIIYNRLRQHGLTEAAALGMLGNWQEESSCEPYRLQGDFSPYRTNSKAYVQQATNGQMSKTEFCRAVGFGLAQWTYPARKANLWDFWKSSGKALDDAEMQTDFAMRELRSEYKALLSFLQSTNDIFTATSRICREYERPAINNIDARFSSAKKIQHEIDLNAWESGSDSGEDEPQPQPEPAPMPEPAVLHPLHLRTTDEHCYGWPESYLVQALLICRGFKLHVVDGTWDDEDMDALALFQSENGLKPDAIAGPLTWAKLLER